MFIEKMDQDIVYPRSLLIPKLYENGLVIIINRIIKYTMNSDEYCKSIIDKYFAMYFKVEKTIICYCLKNKYHYYLKNLITYIKTSYWKDKLLFKNQKDLDIFWRTLYGGNFLNPVNIDIFSIFTPKGYLDSWFRNFGNIHFGIRFVYNKKKLTVCVLYDHKILLNIPHEYVESTYFDLLLDVNITITFIGINSEKFVFNNFRKLFNKIESLLISGISVCCIDRVYLTKYGFINSPVYYLFYDTS
jgi:hypothetical protein